MTADVEYTDHQKKLSKNADRIFTSRAALAASLGIELREFFSFMPLRCFWCMEERLPRDLFVMPDSHIICIDRRECRRARAHSVFHVEPENFDEIEAIGQEAAEPDQMGIFEEVDGATEPADPPEWVEPVKHDMKVSDLPPEHYLRQAQDERQARADEAKVQRHVTKEAKKKADMDMLQFEEGFELDIFGDDD